MKKKKVERTIRSSAAEYLTYVASVGDQQDSIGMHPAVHGHTAAELILVQKLCNTRTL